MRTIIGLVVVLIVIVGAIYFTQNYVKGNPFLFAQTGTATINGKNFKVTVAKRDDQKQIGLSEKASLNKDEGMIFVYDSPGYYSFWMKGMKFPIDIIFLKDNTVVTVYENVQPVKENESPLLYQPQEPANSVLELTAGSAKDNKITKGTKITTKNI